MTYTSQIKTLGNVSGASSGWSRRDARRLPPGIGLAAGALVSLSLWAGLIHLVFRLIG